MCSLKSVFLACYSVKYDVRLFWNVSTSSIFNYSSPWWSEERNCIYRWYLMFVHFCISVDDIAWFSCFVVVYNLEYLSLSDDEKLCETSIVFWFFFWFLIMVIFKSFSMLVTELGSLLYWCLMKRADLLCTISIFLIWFSWYGSQALLAYAT